MLIGGELACSAAVFARRCADEHPAHLYLRRAKASARLLGPPSAAHVLVARGLETHLGGEQ